MILTCPSCSTRFLLPAYTLAPAGRRVKCSHCSAVWHQEPDLEELKQDTGADLEDIPESVKPIPEGSSVPAIPEEPADIPASQRPPGILAGYSAASLVFIIGLAGFLLAADPIARAWPASAAFYRMVGLDVLLPGEGLVFDRLKATAHAEPASGGAEMFLLEGQIINLTRKTLNIPLIEVRLKSAEGKETGHWLIESSAERIGPEQTLPFRVQHASTSQAQEIELRFTAADKPKTAAKDGGNNQVPHPDG